MRYIIFDAGPIISLAMNGLLPVLEKLKNNFDGEFILTPAVRKEVIDKPMKIKRFKLEAIKVANLLDRGIFKMAGDVVSNARLTRETNDIMKLVNGVFRSVKTNEKINLIQEGEVSCLAFSRICGGDSLIVVDERSTRMMFESSQNLKKMMERKLHTDLDANFDLIKNLGSFKFVRSTELIYMAYKKDLIGFGKSRDVLDALLYGLKFRGTTISSKEIDEIKGLFKR
jgi:hypothetical protein